MRTDANYPGFKVVATSDGTSVTSTMSGVAVDNLKAEIKAEMKAEITNYINKEIERVTDEKIKLQLGRLNDAIKQKDKTLFDETIAEMIKSGASTIVSEIIKKVLLGA